MSLTVFRPFVFPKVSDAHTRVHGNVDEIGKEGQFHSNQEQCWSMSRTLMPWVCEVTSVQR